MIFFWILGTRYKQSLYRFQSSLTVTPGLQSPIWYKQISLYLSSNYLYKLKAIFIVFLYYRTRRCTILFHMDVWSMQKTSYKLYLHSSIGYFRYRFLWLKVEIPWYVFFLLWLPNEKTTCTPPLMLCDFYFSSYQQKMR